MALHVDIIKTEPLAGTERLLARVCAEHGQVVIESPDEAYWRDALMRAVDMDPDQDPEAFLQALSERLDGTYVFATNPHDEAECEHAAEPPRESAPA
jgi:hypothetical protein